MLHLFEHQMQYAIFENYKMPNVPNIVINNCEIRNTN